MLSGSHSPPLGMFEKSGHDVAKEGMTEILPVSKSKTPRGNYKILIVQGDWECGMRRVALDLIDAGHHVSKVVFCASDYIYRLYDIRTHSYRASLAEFADWLRDLIDREGYDTLFLYNHYRPYNQIAWDLAHELDINCHVFELGLIRPNCVTVFERRSFPISSIPAAWQRVLEDELSPVQHSLPPALCQVSTPAKLSRFITSFLFSRLTARLFPNFVDQREMNLSHHIKHGAIHLYRFFERRYDRSYDALFSGELSGNYYAVPLQVHSDTQILRCSSFKSIESFIKKVVDSFAGHAPPGTKLVFKVHPMDRGYKDYTDLVHGLNDELGGERLIYVDRVHLPTLLNHALGVVNINSSVGLSGLVHHAPVIALGDAVYDLPELTFQGTLDDFWNHAERPCERRVKQFLNLLLDLNQGRGTLSQQCFDVPGRSRIQWPKVFQETFFPETSGIKQSDHFEKAG
ncbi:MAG: hypothetical protein V4733_09930 [Verrucomicrobiota bacterium]